ncbi:putative zinc finger c2h2-type protein [Diplodia seriata]|uniref:Putative zinc finger c2h2-type protein n=1 Tax=Diplodia seriata TaxID=420778 RepID=A0A0G2EWR5_9PEZI|nr:putative zinc finger c2h2-type protein [Diplodia seriata]
MSKPGAASASVDDFDFDDVFDSSSESNNHSSDEDYDPGVDFPEDDFAEDDLPEDDFTEDDFAEDGLANDDNVEDSAPWWRFKFPLGSSSTYYKCPPHLTEHPDADVARLIDEFENNLRIAGITQTLEDFAGWQKNAAKLQHFGGGPAPDKPPKREWPQNKAVKTVAYHLAIAANDGLPLLPLSGNEPWTRDDNIGFWTGKLPAGNIVSKRKFSTLSELSDDSSSLFVPSRYATASNGLLQANPSYGILKSPGSTAQPGPSPRSPRGSTGQFDVGGSSEGLVDDDLFFRDFDGDYTMVDAPPLRRRSSESPQLRRTPSKVRFDLPNGPSGSSDLGGGFAGPAFMMPKDGGLFGNESPFLEIKLYDGRLDADGTITLPDTSRRFRVWRWSDSTWGPDRARAQHEDFWRIAEELLGSQLQGPEDEVELRVYSEDGMRSENDCIWVDRRVKPETFQEMMDAWLEYVTGSVVYLIPVPKVSRPFLPAASPGISYRALAKQFSTLQIAEGTRIGSVLHRARSFSIPNIPNAVAGTLSGWLRPQRASTVDEPDDVAFPPFDPTDCVDCGLYIATPDEYAEHYMKHFRGRIGAPQATHPGVQWALEQAGFQHSCPTKKKKKLFPDSSPGRRSSATSNNIFDESYTTPQHRLHRTSQSRRPASTPRGRRTRRRLSTASPIISSTSPFSQAPAPAPPPVRLTANELLAALSDDQENERVRRASLGPTFPSPSSSSLLLHRPGANSHRQRLGQYTPAARGDDDAASYAAMRGRFRSGSSSGYHHGLPPEEEADGGGGGITIPPALARAIAAGQPVAEIEVEWGEVVGASGALTAFWERVKRALELEDRATIPAAEGSGDSDDEGEDISDKEMEQRIAMELEQNIAKQLEEEITAGKKRKRAGKADETYRSNKKVRGEEEVPEEKKRGKPNGKTKGSASIKKTVTIEVSREAVPESPSAKPKRKSTAGTKDV